MLSPMLRRIAEDLTLAITFMTRIPVPAGWIRPDRRLAEAFWAMPLAGAVAGGIGAIVMVAGIRVGLDTTIAAIAAVIAMVLITGALHEDGLADLCDGVGGGRTPEERLTIMRDSRIGTYGTTAVVLALVSLVTLLDELAVRLSDQRFIAAIAITAALARASIAIPLTVLKPARESGLAIVFGKPASANLLFGACWPTVAAVAVLGPAGIAAVIGVLVAAGAVSAIAARYLRGHTGDVFGALITLAFISGLLGMKIVLA